MRLSDLWITSVVRCAPPANKPTPEELRNCAPWLDQELRLLANLRVVVCLGRIAFDGLLTHQQRAGHLSSRSGFVFGHGAEVTLPSGLIAIASYHPSLQNTNTGKLTRPMLLAIFKRARPSVVVEDAHKLFGVKKSYSFPSVHAVNFSAALPILATVFPAGAIPYAVVASLVCLSRVYVGDHWPSDVLGGIALGLAVGWLGRKAFLRLEQNAKRWSWYRSFESWRRVEPGVEPTGEVRGEGAPSAGP